MKTQSCYKVHITHSHWALRETVALYRSAVDFIIDVVLLKWDAVSAIEKPLKRQQFIERIIHTTTSRPIVEFPEFDKQFHKFPSYLRRAAIAEAIGKVQSYKSLRERWGKMGGKKKPPSDPHAGYAFPTLYGSNMFERVDDYHAKIKVFLNNDWVWLEVPLNKSDVDYIKRNCSDRKALSPTLRRRGKKWYLDFSFEENTQLKDTPIEKRKVLAVDLNIDASAVGSVMDSNGTVIARRFLHQDKDNDLLSRSITRIKNAQRNGSRRMPHLWAIAKGVNQHLSARTAQFIADMAEEYDVDVVVFEHLEVRGKKRGKPSRRQRLHHWRCQYVQAMVAHKVHRQGRRFSRVCAWGTSRLAFDGSGRVQRGREINMPNCICRFQTGKVYNCDLNATYNIGARYFIREIQKTTPETEWQALQAKVPALSKRSHCTLADLIGLQAVLEV